MNIRLHIERLVLDGVPLGLDGRRALQAAVEAELTQLLTDGGLSAGLLSGGAVPQLQAEAIQLASDENPARLGTQVAQVVYDGLSNPQAR
jgi:hypothetical protein